MVDLDGVEPRYPGAQLCFKVFGLCECLKCRAPHVSATHVPALKSMEKLETNYFYFISDTGIWYELESNQNWIDHVQKVECLFRTFKTHLCKEEGKKRLIINC